MKLSSKLLNKSTYRQKILLGFIVLLLVIGATVGVSVITARQVQTNTNLFIESMHDAEAASALQQSMIDLQRIAQLYFNSPDERILEDLREHQQRVSYHAQAVRGILHPNRVTEEFDTVQALISTYNTNLDIAIALVQQQRDLTYVQLRGISDEIDEFLNRISVTDSVVGSRDTLITAIYVNGIKSSLDAARLDVQIYLNTADGERINGAHNSIDNAIERLWTLLAIDEQETTLDASQRVIELVPVYRQTVVKIVDVTTAIKEIQEQSLDVSFRKVLERSRNISELASNKSNAIQLSMLRTTEDAVVIILIVGGSGLLLGVGFAWVISTGLVRSLGEVTNSMIRLSKGDLSAEVPATSRSDEVGELARAFHVFRETSQSLIYSEQRFRRIYENAAEGICRTTLDGQFIEVNPAMAHMHGCATSEEFMVIYGEDIAEKYYANSKTRDDLVVQLTQFGSVSGTECEVQHTDGSMFWVSVSARAVKDKRGKVTGFEAFIHNISERKRAEDALNKALSDAECANQTKSKFLAAMSHELRTPLNAILGFSEILAEQCFGPPGAGKYREYAKDIHHSGRHLLQIVNDLLDISTIEAGETNIAKEMLSVTEIVEDCGRVIDEKIQSKNIDFQIEMKTDLSMFYADKRASKQILINLLWNAVKFTPVGGRISISVKATGHNILFAITDTGVGISADRLLNITDPFTRGESNPHVTDDGWGLGLSITKSLVDLHDGEMNFASEVGKGTTVTVTLPIQG